MSQYITVFHFCAITPVATLLLPHRLCGQSGSDCDSSRGKSREGGNPKRRKMSQLSEICCPMWFGPLCLCSLGDVWYCCSMFVLFALRVCRHQDSSNTFKYQTYSDLQCVHTVCNVAGTFWYNASVRWLLYILLICWVRIRNIHIVFLVCC